ncbi:MAG: glycosyltransferase N-terminal domain-containing protein, partial [Candidatus Poribacteria bacterium]
RMIWRLFYNVIFIPLLYVLYRIYALFDGKARDGINGRKGLFDKIKKQIPFGLTDERKNFPVIWFHCASVGEFEQARPIIDAVKDKYRIVVTFFSPSGYNLASKYPHADLICYLPFDTARNARKMFELINPAMLIFVKFDVWANFVWTAKKRNIPVFLVDATLHEKSKRLSPFIRSFMKSIHKNIYLHCAISEVDSERLKLFSPEGAKIEVTGDTRFDQVIARRNSAGKKLKGLLPKFEIPVIIAGSTYTEDEAVVIDAYKKTANDWGKVQLILVPHEPEPERLKEISKVMSDKGLPYLFLADLEKKHHKGETIIIDKVGFLAELYMLGDIAFIGGSFHGSVHNVMEPAVMGKPVLFGPTIHNSLEAFMLMEHKAGIMVRNSDEMAKELIILLSDSELRLRLGQTAQALIEDNAGATEKIVKHILLDTLDTKDP